ncbi:SacI homology domain containing protein [Trichomonas vaginalis G3]|uniref:SacI homology domain containing protein n=1 Tax=Trichomonas vaginalis (strain ATCC PRA-98 / G3) TaxID=412133 RepID=A2DKI2_TRIV3|nr:SacI homology domain containing protein [Trichomonas vaginalis G3]|eukprot:XP_001580145.1 SacI homology domain containing protein [Trichomonas vaginalis G3]
MKLILDNNYVSIDDENQTIIIDRKTLQLQNNTKLNDQNEKYDFLFPLGIYKLNDELYIVIVTEDSKISNFRNIQKIESYKIIQITTGITDNNIYNLLKRGLDLCSMYYSKNQNENLAINYQDFLQGRKSRGEFTWNKVPMKRFQDIFKTEKFTIPVVAGYVSYNDPFMIIARRSRNFAGAHYWNRGADENGHPANFIESEELYFKNDKIYSYIQLRGSIPALWSQTPPEDPFLPPALGPLSESKRRFDLHSKKFLKNYKNVKVISLTSDKNREKSLTLLYHNLLDENNIHYKHMNVNELQRVDGGIYKAVDEELKDSDLLVCEKGIVKKCQTCYTRTNCLSCLDRANVVQSNAGEIILSYFEKLTEEEILKLKQLWVDHGNAISYQYSLTGAQRTQMTLSTKAVFAADMKDNYMRVKRLLNEVSIEGKATDAYCVVTQDTDIVSFKRIGWFKWLFLLIFSFFISIFVLIVYRDRRKAFHTFKKYGGEVVDHPHYRTTLEADEQYPPDNK